MSAHPTPVPSARRPIRLVFVAAAALLALGCEEGEKKKGTYDAEVFPDVFLTGGGPNRLVVDGDDGYVVNGDNTVQKIDLSTCSTAEDSCETAGSATLPILSFPYDGAVVGGSLYVSTTGDDKLVRIDTSTMAITASIHSNGGFTLSTPQSMTEKNGTLYVANGASFGFAPGYVAMVEGTTLTGTIATTQLFPVSVQELPNGKLLVVNSGLFNFETEEVTEPGGLDIIDPGSDEVEENIQLGNKLPGPIAAITDDGAFAFVPANEGRLLRVNLEDGSVSTYEIAGADVYFSWIVLDEGLLYLMSFGEDTTYVLDADSLELLGTIVTGPGGETPRGPVHGVVRELDGEKFLLIVEGLANAITAVRLP